MYVSSKHLAYPTRSIINKDAADVLTFILGSSSHSRLNVAKENTPNNIRVFSLLRQRKLFDNYDSTSLVNSQLVMEDSREVGVDFYLARRKESPEYGRNHMREPVVNTHGVKSDQLLTGILLERSGELGERQVDHGLHQCSAPHAAQVLLEEESSDRQQNSGDGFWVYNALLNVRVCCYLLRQGHKLSNKTPNRTECRH